jgi:hypothetical protein
VYACSTLLWWRERISSDRNNALALSPIGAWKRYHYISLAPSAYPHEDTCGAYASMLNPLVLTGRLLRSLRMWHNVHARASLKERGFSLIEAVVALGLASLIFIGSLATFTNTMAGMRAAGDANLSALATFKAHAVIATALYTLEKNRLPFTLTITPGNRLSLPHGEPHPLAALKGTSAPRVDSDIISVIEISPLFRGRIRSSSRSGTGFLADACGMYEAPGKEDFKSVVAFAVDGAVQAVGEISKINTTCARFNGTLISGLISSSQVAIGTPLELAAITREQSLFVDRSGELRLASHVGSRITENQPLTRGLRSIRIVPVNDDARIPIYSIVVRPSYGSERKRFLLPGLARRSLVAEVLP